MKAKLSILLLLLYLVASAQSRKSGSKSQLPVKNYSLAWSEEFSGNLLNLTKWKYRAIGKRGDAINSVAAVSLNGKGELVIRAFEKSGEVYAGIIDTEGLFETRYGYFECRARLTNTKGIWPAFWLQSSRNTDNGEPETDGAEIDIFEYFQHQTKDSVSHTLHWGGYGRTHKVAGPVKGALKKTPDNYHVFGLEWTANSYKTFVDGLETYSGNGNISHVKEFIVLSLEINKQVAGVLDRKQLPDSFMVDYVRVYKKNIK